MGHPPHAWPGNVEVHAQVSLPTSDGHHAAALAEGEVVVVALDAPDQWTHKAAPLGWYLPALAWPAVAWVEQGVGEDIWWLPDATSGQPALLAGGPGHQRHVVGAGTWLAWVDGGDLVRMNLASGERTHIETETGFNAPPTLTNDGVLCWEVRDGADIDIHCSDGLEINDPGHQTWPSRHKDWLIYREGDELHLVTRPVPLGEP